MTFKELGLAEPILKALEEQGYTNPTPIQEQAIPILLKRKDLLGVAQTGT
jgi:ATP-dependent RNA helicase RhlE